MPHMNEISNAKEVTYEHRVAKRYRAGFIDGYVYMEKGRVLAVTETPEKLAHYCLSLALGTLGPFGPDMVEVVKIEKD